MNDFEERIRTDPAPAAVTEAAYKLIETIRQMVDTNLQPNRESLVPTLHEQIDKILVAVTNDDWTPAKASSSSSNLVKQIDISINLVLCCSDLDARYEAAIRFLKEVFALISSVTNLPDTYKAAPAFAVLSDVIENPKIMNYTQLQQQHLTSKIKFQEQIQTATIALLKNDGFYIKQLGLKINGKVRVDFDDSYVEYALIHSYDISDITSEVTLNLIKPNSRGQISKKPAYKDYLTGIKLDRITLLPDDFDMRPSKLPKPDLCF